MLNVNASQPFHHHGCVIHSFHMHCTLAYNMNIIYLCIHCELRAIKMATATPSAQSPRELYRPRCDGHPT